MLVISLIKILTQIILPPGLIVLVLLLSAYYFFKKGIRSGLYINLFVAMTLYITFIEPFQDHLYGVLESGLTLNARAEGDVIIVLGGGIYEDSPDLTGNTIPSDEALARVVMAYRLYKIMDVPIITTGGRLTETDISESEIAKRFLVDLGVPERDIVSEDNSRTTIENAFYTKEILKRMGFKRPVLVTTAYHMKRAILCFKFYNIDVIPAPCSFRSTNRRTYKIFNYFPGPANPFPPLKELLGIAYMKILIAINR